MIRDIDIVIERVRAIHPDAKVAQLKVKFPADDDGLWFFGFPEEKREIQVESSTGAAPFIIEHSGMSTTNEAICDASVDQAVQEITAYLVRLKKK